MPVFGFKKNAHAHHNAGSRIPMRAVRFLRRNDVKCGWARMSTSRPVFEEQSGNLSEVTVVGGHEGATVREGKGGRSGPNR